MLSLSRGRDHCNCSRSAFASVCRVPSTQSCTRFPLLCPNLVCTRSQLVWRKFTKSVNNFRKIKFYFVFVIVVVVSDVPVVTCHHFHWKSSKYQMTQANKCRYTGTAHTQVPRYTADAKLSKRKILFVIHIHSDSLTRCADKRSQRLFISFPSM